MEKHSTNFKLAFFAFLLLTISVPTFGVSNGGIRMPQTKIIIEELAVKNPEVMTAGEEITIVQLEPQIMETSQQGEVLQCAKKGDYCTRFGPHCCKGTFCKQSISGGAVCASL